MNRRTIPAIEMHEYGQEHLRREGIVILPLMDSMAGDPQRLHPHYHDFFQVSLITGHGRLMHDFREQEIDRPTLFFMRPGQVHTIGVRQGLGGTVISFTQAFFDHVVPPPSRLYELPFFAPGTAVPWLFLEPTQVEPMAAMFGSLQHEFDSALEGAGEVLRAMLHILFVRAARLYAAVHPAGQISRGSVLARQFSLEVEHHFREWQSLTPYARLLGVNVSHLNEVVREQTGHAPGDIIRQRRLLDAKRLLLHSDLSVSEIGYQLGFDDPSYFSRFFRRYTLATPAQFRDEIREKYQSGHH